MKLITSSLSMTSLLIISLLQTPALFAAGVNAGAGAATTNDTGAATTTNGNPAATSGNTPPPATTNPAPGNLKNKQLNQPANNSRDMNQPMNAGKARNNTNTVTPSAPANNCYTVDGQPSATTDCLSGTNPNVR